MEHRRLGSTDLTVSLIGLGCYGMSGAYGPADDVESIATIRRALDQPAEVRGDKDSPLLSVERAVPRYSPDRVHLRHASLLPVQQRPDYG